MSNRWKNIFLLFIFILTALIFFNLIYKWSFPDTKWDLSGNGEKIKIKSGQLIKQEFKAERNNLSRIRILFGRSYNKDAGKINLKLTDGICENVIRKKSFERSAIQSEGYYDFRFSKIIDSNDKNFCLIIEFKPQKEKYKELNIFLSSDPISENKLMIDGETKNGALAMRPAYQTEGFWNNISELNQRISQFKPWFLKNIYLYTVFFVFILSVSIFLVLIIRL